MLVFVYLHFNDMTFLYLTLNFSPGTDYKPANTNNLNMLVSHNMKTLKTILTDLPGLGEEDIVILLAVKLLESAFFIFDAAGSVTVHPSSTATILVRHCGVMDTMFSRTDSKTVAASVPCLSHTSSRASCGVIMHVFAAVRVLLT